MIISGTRPRRFGGVLVTIIVLVAGTALGLARGTTPSAVPAAHPAIIHQGTCAELGDVVFPLTAVAAETAHGATREAVASPAAAGARIRGGDQLYAARCFAR